MKSKRKNRKSIKYMKHIKITNHRKSVRRKYTYKNKGGAFLAAGLAKNLAKKAFTMGASTLKDKVEDVERKGPSLFKTALSNPISLSKFKPRMPHFDEDRDIKYYFKKGMYALYKVMSSLVTLPIRNLDEVIPPELCKQFTDNNFICSQPMIQYLLTGTKQDYKKILLEKDANDCIQFDEDGNKIVKCKSEQKGGRGGNIVVGCDKTSTPKFKKNDRVIVYLNENEQNENANSAYVELNDKKWIIGTIILAKDNYTIQIDNGGILTRPYSATTEEIREYNNDWNEFYKEFYNMPKIVLQDFYDTGHKYGDPLIKRLNEILKIIYKKSNIYRIVGLFVYLSKYTWQAHKTLITLDKKNKFVASINTLIDKYKSANLDYLHDNRLRTKIIFINMMMIYDRYLDGKSIDETLEELDDKTERMQDAISKKLKIIEEKLVKFNLYLRKYECPMSKVESLLNTINNAELLENMLKTCTILLGDENNYKPMEGEDEKEKRKKRIQSCDLTYDYDLTVKPDSTHLDFNIDPEQEPPSCESCSSNKWAEVIVRYGCFFSKALNGNKNNMTYILINIVQDMATINNSNDSNQDEDPVILNIKHILQNIECRSNLREVISNRIQALNIINQNSHNDNNDNNNNDNNDNNNDNYYDNDDSKNR
jgi:hypothetical protein